MVFMLYVLAFNNGLIVQYGRISDKPANTNTIYFPITFTTKPVGNLSFCTSSSMSYTPLMDTITTSYVILSRQFDTSQHNPTVDKMFIFIGY